MLCAWKWTEGHNRVLCKEADISKKEQDVASVKKEEERHNKELLDAEKECKEVKAKRDKEMRKGGKFRKREEDVAELEKGLVKMRTQADIKKATIEEEEKKVVSLVEETKEVCEHLVANPTSLKCLLPLCSSMPRSSQNAKRWITSKLDILA